MGQKKKFRPLDLIRGPLHVDTVVDIHYSRHIQTIATGFSLVREIGDTSQMIVHAVKEP